MVALNALQPLDLLRGCACTVIFTLLLSLDAWKAVERKAFRYREVLESIAMPGEKAESLWIANETAFNSTKEHMEQGRGSTGDLMEIIRRLKAEAPADEGEGEEIYGEEEKYLKYFSKMSSKMRAVSLIHFMLCYYEDTHYEVVGDAFKACSGAWALMDFVESSETKANFVSLAANKEFNTLENIWKENLKLKPIQSKEKLAAIKKEMQEDIESRISKGESEERVNNMSDSMDWMTAAADMSLNKTSKMIESKAIDLHSANAIHDLGCLLAKVIVNCLGIELNNALIQNCCKWAVDGEEEKIYHAAFLAGKAMAVSDLFQTGQDNNAVPLTGVAEGEGNDSSGNNDG